MNNNRSNFVGRILLLIVTLSTAAPGVYAQEESGTSGFALEEIVVSARRVEEVLQTTPIAVSAFTADGLQDRQIDSTDQLVRATPNIQFTSQSPASGNNASSQIFIRGIGQTDFLPSTDPGVGMYLDGVYLARSVGATMDFLDVERVEVLKGPQGTLFGRNTIGGAINIVTKKPQDEFGGRAFIKVGDDSRLDLFGTVDFALSDNLNAKITAASRDRDGYVTRLRTGEQTGDDNKLNFRSQLRWSPSDNVEVNYSFDYNDQDEVGGALVYNRLNPNQAFFSIAGSTPACNATGAPPNRDSECANNEFAAGPYANNGTYETFSTFELMAHNLTLEWNLGNNATFKSITGYRETEWTGSRDADNTPLTVLHTAITDDQNQFSQEFQLTGFLLEDKLTYLLGLYYFDEEDDNGYFVQTAPGDFSLDAIYNNSTVAAFSNLTYRLSDKLSLTAGLRAFEEEKSITPNQRTLTTYVLASPVACSPASALSDPGNPLFNPGCAANPRPPVILLPPGVSLLPTSDVKRTFSDVTPVVSFAYEFNDNVFGYASYSEGFKSGGYNARNVFPLRVVPEFDEETASSIELGLKSTLLEGSLRLNAAAFATDYDDIQIVLRQDFAPININAGKASLQGFELEAEYVPSSRLLLQGALGYTDTEYDELSALALANGVKIDNQLAFAPEWTANLGVAYILDLANKGTLTPRLDWSYQSKIFFDAVNTEAISQDSYSVLNASIAYRSSNEQWGVRLGVTNLADEVYRVAGFTSYNQVAAYEEVAFARGREWSLTVNLDF